MLDKGIETQLVETIFPQILKLGFGSSFNLLSLVEASFDQTGVSDRLSIKVGELVVSRTDLGDLWWSLLEYAENHGIYLHEDLERIDDPRGYCTVYKHAKPWKVSSDMVIARFVLRSGSFLAPSRVFTYENGVLRFDEYDMDSSLSREAKVFVGNREARQIRHIFDVNEVFKWKRRYENYDVADGMGWSLVVAFDNDAAYASNGYVDTPNTYYKVIESLAQLIVGYDLIQYATWGQR